MHHVVINKCVKIDLVSGQKRPNTETWMQEYVGLTNAHLLDLYCAFICLFWDTSLRRKHSADASIQVSVSLLTL